MHATYLYCLVRRARRPAVSGLAGGLPGAGAPTVVRADGDLWMVVAEVPLARYGPGLLEASLRDIDWVASAALAHEQVVASCARAAGGAVIPMKLFTMFSTAERAAGEMRRRRASLDRVFDRIAGCEEWGVKVVRRADRASLPVGTRAATGAAFLSARKHARDERRRVGVAAAEAADAAFDSLLALARDGRRRRGGTGTAAPLLDAAFLVPSRRRARFHAAVERAAHRVKQSGGELTVTGPWPPYNFVSPEQGA
jgi:hypothetical protein